MQSTIPHVNLHNPAVRRRLYITIAQKRVQPGSGSGPQTLWARTWRQPVFDLRTILSVPFVVVGGVATRLYAPERMTDDLDVLIEEKWAEKLTEELGSAGCRAGGRLAVGGSHWVLPDTMALDVLESTESWAAEAIRQPMFGPDGLPVIALPFLILMKLRASRGIDIGDLTRILGAASENDLDKTRTVIAAHELDALEDLESLIALGRLEYALTVRDDTHMPE